MSKLFLVVGLLFGLSTTACTSVQTRVNGTLLVERTVGSAPEQLQYEAVESHSTVGLAVLCLLTAIYYGGSCWAYLALPFDDHEISAFEHARSDAASLGRCVALQNLKVEGAGYRASARTVRITAANGRELNPFEVQHLCDQRAVPPPSTPPPAPQSDPAS
jgi:hypothetical protein